MQWRIQTWCWGCSSTPPPLALAKHNILYSWDFNCIYSWKLLWYSVVEHTCTYNSILCNTASSSTRLASETTRQLHWIYRRKPWQKGAHKCEIAWLAHWRLFHEWHAPYSLSFSSPWSMDTFAFHVLISMKLTVTWLVENSATAEGVAKATVCLVDRRIIQKARCSNFHRPFS